MAPAQNVSTEGLALSKFRTVDVFSGDGVWAVLDEGCTSCCRGKAGAHNAGDKFEKMDFFPEWSHRQRKTRSGVGGQAGIETTGKKSLPRRIVASRGAVSGCLESQQLKYADHVPLSLSLPARASLGLAKDLANGRALLSQEGEVEMRGCARP
eukprot:805325-Pyramimonas_sp.AAC.1